MLPRVKTHVQSVETFIRCTTNRGLQRDLGLIELWFAMHDENGEPLEDISFLELKKRIKTPEGIAALLAYHWYMTGKS